MSRSRMFRLTALSGLMSLSLFAVARAQDPAYNVATDWASTYANSAAVVASTSATWGAGHVWSAGVFSFNWTNESNVTFNPPNGNVQYLATYYNPTTAAETSAGTTVATFTYTVPFQAYQLNPGSTIHVATSPEVSAQSNSGFTSVTGQAVKLPTGWTATNTTTTGSIQEVAKAAGSGFVATEVGFTTSHSGTMKDGGGTVQDQLAGAFYNYATTNSTGTSVAMQNAASGSLDHVIMLEGAMGPAYVAWTAPSAGTLSAINVNAWDLHESVSDNDGFPGFAIYAGTATTLGTALFSALNTGASGVGSIESYVHANVGTGTANIAGLNGYSTTGTNGASFGVNWTDASLAITAGEVLYFISDSAHSFNGNHAFLGGADPIALQTNFNFTPSPEPSSIVLLGMAGVGLALAAWRRRRAA
jgi:PEP-CTERM motif